MNKEKIRAYNAAYRILRRERIKENLAALKTDFDKIDLLSYKESLIDGGNIFYNEPRIFRFVFKNLVGEYLINKENQKFVSAEFLSIFFTKNYLETCEKFKLKKGGEFYKINRETALISQNSTIDLILRIIESNKKSGRARQYIHTKNGERVNIELKNN
jgi:hypothetical protein